MPEGCRRNARREGCRRDTPVKGMGGVLRSGSAEGVVVKTSPGGILRVSAGVLGVMTARGKGFRKNTQ